MNVETVQIGSATLIRGDALEAMESLRGQLIDAVLTDPPYCSGAATEAGRGASAYQGLRSETIRSGRFAWFGGDNMTTAGLCALLRGMAVAANDLLAPAGSILTFCDWRMAFQVGPAMESAGYRLRNLLVWDKGHFGCGTGFRPQHEMILHLSRRSPKFYAADVGNVIRCKRVGSGREHPTEKPVDLLSALVRVVSPAGGTVLDPFMGSASAGVAAVQSGRRFIGCEVSPEYFAIACRRIEAAQAEAKAAA